MSAAFDEDRGPSADEMLEEDADVLALDRALSDLERRAAMREELLLREARRQADAFVAFAIRHEKTGKALRNAPHHVEWHRHLDSNRYAILFAPVEHGKTIHIGIGRALWRLGNDPTRRIAIVSNTLPQAQKLLGSIRQHIENNPRVRRVFPHLRKSPDPSDPWHSTQLVVDRRLDPNDPTSKTIAKDPSVQALGVHGPINGSRVDTLILDDILDFENTRTIDQRKKILDWFESTAFPRVTDDGEIWFIGTPWMPDDLMHELSKRAGFRSLRYSAVLNPNDDPAAWRALWPEQMSANRIRATYASITPSNFARAYLCETRMDAHARFRQEWLDKMLEKGKGWRPFAQAPVTAGKAWPCFTGVDLGVGESSDHDLTCIFTIALEPGTRRRVVCEIQSGRWQAPEIVSRIIDTYKRFGSIVVVESNGAQKFLAQFAGAGGLPVRPFFTSAQNKYDEHFGVETLAVEMRNEMWLAPSGPTGQLAGSPFDIEVKEWHRELLFYDPELHTGDRMMASWFAREAARNYAPDKTFGKFDVQYR